MLKAGTGVGTVTSDPAGINCGNDCVKNYVPGKKVRLKAAAANGSYFAGWSGEECQGITQTTCMVTLTKAKTITARFERRQYRLTVRNTGNGSGTVTSSPPGINCGSDCSENYDTGTQVTLTATPTTASVFAGWNGCSSATGTTCMVTLTNAKTTTARFKRQ